MSFIRFCFVAMALFGWLACSEPGTAPPNPDDELGCSLVPALSSTPYQAASDFGPVEPDSLRGWEPNGVWFIGGLGPNKTQIIRFTRYPASPAGVFSFSTALGNYDQSVAFVQGGYQRDDVAFHYAIRFSNLRSDGTLRYDSADCDGGRCQVCRGRVHTAAWLPNEGESQNLVKVGEIGERLRTAYNVRVLGNYAYLAYDSGVRIIDIRDPAHPVVAGTWGAGGKVNDLKLVQAGARIYALIAFTPSRIVDVTDPAHPTTVVELPESTHTVFTETRGDHIYAYWGELNGACPVYDVTDPLHPQLLSRFQTAGAYLHDMSANDGIAYLNAWDAGLYRVDYTDPKAPVLTGRWATTPAGYSHSSWPTTVGGRKLVLHGNEGAGARLSVVDADPGSRTYMQEIGSFQTRAETSIHNIMAIGDRAYITYYHDGVRVLDLADPTAPKQIGYFNTWDPSDIGTGSWLFESAIGIDVDPAKRLIYVADTQRGLIILQDQTPR